ncbi:MAG TPA: hypothetical protein VN181_07540 [Thermoanaerobaculia bacterium]|nr:hypothetical protein [Thermoanaerobaculia bacterium]
MTPEPATIPTSLLTVLIVAVTTLAGVIVYLWKHYQAKLDKIAEVEKEVDKGVHQERLLWAAERQRLAQAQEDFEVRLRLEFETKHRAAVEDCAKRVADAVQASRDREDSIRREYAENMTLVAERAEASSAKLATVMEKFYDRYVSPRSRMKG